MEGGREKKKTLETRDYFISKFSSIYNQMLFFHIF